MFKNLVFCN